MRILGNVFIGVGVVLMITFVFWIPGAIAVGLGCLMRFVAGPKEPAEYNPY